MDRGLLKALVTAGMAAQSCDPAIPHAANFGQAPATESPTPIGVMADNKVLAGVNVQLAEQVTELERELAQAESTAAELRGALEKAKQAIRDLAQSGTERIRELGAECDPWEKTAGIAIRQAGLEEALAQPREGGSGKYASPVDEVERLKGALERIRRDSDSCDDAWEILARIGNIASDALQPLPPAGGKGGGK